MQSHKSRFLSSSRAVALEPRLLFDGAGAVAGAEALTGFGDTGSGGVDAPPEQSGVDAPLVTESSGASEVIDAGSEGIDAPETDTQELELEPQSQGEEEDAEPGAEAEPSAGGEGIDAPEIDTQELELEPQSQGEEEDVEPGAEAEPSAGGDDAPAEPQEAAPAAQSDNDAPLEGGLNDY